MAHDDQTERDMIEHGIIISNTSNGYMEIEKIDDPDQFTEETGIPVRVIHKTDAEAYAAVLLWADRGLEFAIEALRYDGRPVLDTF